jgi:hypothetical protein
MSYQEPHLKLPPHTSAVTCSVDVTTDVLWKPWFKTIHFHGDDGRRGDFHGDIHIGLLTSKADGQVHVRVGVGKGFRGSDIHVRRGDRAGTIAVVLLVVLRLTIYNARIRFR